MNHPSALSERRAMAKNPKNLIQKPGSSVWYVKLIVPVDVRKVLGRSQFKKSLQTTSVVEAERRKGAYLSAWWDLIDTARAGTPLPEGWEAAVVATMSMFGDAIQNRKRSLIGENVAPMVITPDMKAGMIDNPAIMAVLESLAQQGQVWGGLESQLQAYQNIERLMPDLLPALITDKHKLPPEQHQELTQLVKSPSTYKPASPITESRLEKFRTHRLEFHVAPKTVAQQEAKLRDLSQHIIETGSVLSYDTVSEWLQQLRTKGLSSKTQQQYLLAGSQFWQWVLRHDAQWRSDFKGQDNPFEKHSLPQLKGKAKKDAQRDVFTTEEIAELIAAAKAQGHIELANLILIGTLTGMRIEEIFQLRTEHVIEVDGIQCFDIVDSKTAAGIRIVPVHPSLNTLVRRLVQQSTDGYLLKSDSKNKYGVRSDKLSKAFGKLKTGLGFDKLHVFHSLRGAAVTEMYRAYVPEWIVKCIVGHEGGDVTRDNYNLGASTAQKLDALCKIPVPETI